MAIHASFSSLIGRYFALMFGFAISGILAGWYWGIPPLGLPGEVQRAYATSTVLLEQAADFQRDAVMSSIQERRGDLVSLAENRILADLLGSNSSEIPAQSARVLERIMRAYPERYSDIQFLSADGTTVMGAVNTASVGSPFPYPELLRVIREPGVREWVDLLLDPAGNRATLVVMHKIFAPNVQGYAGFKTVGFVVAFLNQDTLTFRQQGSDRHTLLAADSKNILINTMASKEADLALLEVPLGFEGVLHQNLEGLGVVIACYRYIPVNGITGLRLIHFQTKASMLTGLAEVRNALLLFGGALLLLGLFMVWAAAQRLTRPLGVLTRAVTAVGHGNHPEVIGSSASNCREVEVLSEAFQKMMASVKETQLALEAKVIERTQALDQERGFLRAVIETVPTLIWMKNPEGIYLACNPEFELLYGAKEADIIGKSDYDFVSQELADFFRANDAKAVLKGGTYVNEEWVTYASDGHRVLLETTKTPMRDEQGHLIGVLGVGHDITERKLAELAIANSEKQLRFVLEGAELGFWDWDIAAGTVDRNARWAEMLGYTYSEIAQTTKQWTDFIHPEDREKAWESINAVLTGQASMHRAEYRMLHKDGGVRWILDQASVMQRDAQGKPLRMCGTHTDITERVEAANKIEHLAFFDALTDLPNRRLLVDRLSQALISSSRSGHSGALMLLDLDDFKSLNDTMGHDVGDQFLVEIGHRLRSVIREGDTAARLGGDEFVLIIKDLGIGETAALQAEYVASKILHSVSGPYQLATHAAEQSQHVRSYSCTSSIGIALFADNSISAEELLKRADTSMYQAKAAGRNTLRFFDEKMQELVAAGAELDHDLREALRYDQLRLFYQPQVDHTGRVTGVEALLRWQHPKRGFVSPLDFIPRAETNGMILPIGHWVLETACAQLRTWASQAGKAHLTIAANVSARQFRDKDFVAQVVAVLDNTGADPAKLKLELTESLLLENVDDVIAKMEELQKIGVGFSLDDFGTGYSSLGYLKRLPIDQLKIDRTFVKDILVDPDDAVIAKTIVALTQSMGLHVIAEGVETEDQRKALESIGCLAFQGYLFGAPMPITLFDDMCD